MHKFNPAHIGKLLRKDRLGLATPEELLRSLGLKQGDTLADVGCGPGFFAIPGATIIGPGGRVYAIDTQKEMLEALKKQGLPDNVVPVESTEQSIPVKNGCADMALIAFALHEAADRALFIKEVKRVVKRGGIIVVLDWKKQEEEHGPPVADRLTEDEVKTLLTTAGLSAVEAAPLNESHYRVSAFKS